MVLVSSTIGGTLEVGDTLELTCSVTVVEHLTPSAELSIEWSGGSVKGSGGSGGGSGGSVGASGVVESETRAVNETTSERTMIFSSLNTSHGGQYTCQAVVYIDMIGLMKTGMDIAEIMVQSEFSLSLLWMLICVCLPQSPGQW